jgi:hypothetical protein
MQARPGWFYLPSRSEETKLQVSLVFLILLSSFLSACVVETSTPVLPTPSSSSTPSPVLPTLTLSPTSLYRPINLRCGDWMMINNGEYQARNNTWNKGDITDWQQCIGLGNDTDGTLMARWTWDWPASDTIVAFPSILFGHVPPVDPTTETLPINLDEINSATVSYEIESEYTGRGNVAFDIWLMDTQLPTQWGVPPLTHEIMIWIDVSSGRHPPGRLVDQVSIDGIQYKVYVADNFGAGYRYIAFASETSLLGSESLNLVSFFSYLRQQDLVTGEVYLAAIELGNEIAGPSVGETRLNRYVVSVE